MLKRSEPSRTSVIRDWQPLLLAFAAIAFLATGGIFVRLSEVGPVTTGFYRILFSIPLLYGWMVVDRRSDGRRSAAAFDMNSLVMLSIAGVSLGVDLALWNVSFHYTTVANANLLANLVPFVIVPLSTLFLGEKPAPLFLISLLITVTGLVLLLSGKLNPSFNALKGDALATMTAVFYGIYLFIVARQRNIISTGAVMFYSSFGTLAFLAVVAPMTEQNLFPATLNGWLVLGALAIFSHVAGQGLMALSLGKLPVNLASVIVLLQPVIAALYALALFGERLSWVEIVGVGVTLLGIYMAKRSYAPPPQTGRR